jgi:hypothetical protein
VIWSAVALCKPTWNVKPVAVPLPTKVTPLNLAESWMLDARDLRRQLGELRVEIPAVRI